MVLNLLTLTSQLFCGPHGRTQSQQDGAKLNIVPVRKKQKKQHNLLALSISIVLSRNPDKRMRTSGFSHLMIGCWGYWFLIIERMPVGENGFVLPSIQITSYMIGSLQNVFNIVFVMMFVISKMFPLFVSNVPIENCFFMIVVFV
jgi:hypothetical protein